jgi:hypothetical protein
LFRKFKRPSPLFNAMAGGHHRMESNRPSEDKQLLNSLAEVMPLAREISPEDCNPFFAYIRQWLLWSAEEQSQATNIYRPNDRQTLRQLVDALPWNTEEEILMQLDDLGLPALERDLEAANWAFRHQSVTGEFLVGEELVPFRLVRFQPTLYLLLAAGGRPEIVAEFNEVFSREPAAFSGTALRAEGETWVGWVWQRGGEAISPQAALQQIREIWKATGA